MSDVRAQFDDGDLPLRGDAVSLPKCKQPKTNVLLFQFKNYLEALKEQDNEISAKKSELEQLQNEQNKLEQEVNAMQNKERQVMNQINQLEDQLGIEGYFTMKEQSLKPLKSLMATDDNDDNIEDDQQNTDQFDIETLNQRINSLQTLSESTAAELSSLTREVKQLRTVHVELENEYQMKKRLYDSAAADLETDLARAEAELKRKQIDKLQLETDQFDLETKLTIAKAEFNFRCGGKAEDREQMIKQIKQDIEQEQQKQTVYKKKEADRATNEQYYRKQIEMWQALNELFDVKAKVFAQQQEEQVKNDVAKDANYNHLILN